MGVDEWVLRDGGDWMGTVCVTGLITSLGPNRREERMGGGEPSPSASEHPPLGGREPPASAGEPPALQASSELLQLLGK